MKKILFFLAVFVATACNNGEETNEVHDSAVNDNSAVENVNGNMPDTTNTIPIDGGQTGQAHTDSTSKDSIR